MELILGTLMDWYSEHRDILLHMLAGLILSIISVVHLPLSVTAILIGAAGKEIYDLVTKRGNPEVKDFLCTLFGGLFGIVTLLLFGFVAH